LLADRYVEQGSQAGPGQKGTFGSLLQFPGLFAVVSRNRSLNRRRQVLSPGRLQCSGSQHWQCGPHTLCATNAKGGLRFQCVEVTLGLRSAHFVALAWCQPNFHSRCQRRADGTVGHSGLKMREKNTVSILDEAIN
jgi:hypothetical protein